MRAWEEYGAAVLRHGVLAALGPEPGGPRETPGGLTDAEHRFLASLEEPSLFSGVCRLAHLSLPEAQVLALLVAVELSPDRQRLVAQAQADPGATRLTLASLARLFPESHPGVLAVSEDGRLRRAALVDVEPDGPWGTRQVSVAGPVVWALCGDTSLDPDLPPTAAVLPGPGLPQRPERLHLLAGSDRTTRRTAAAPALGGRGLLVTPAPATQLEWDAVVREATLAGLSVLLEVGDDPPTGLDAVLRRADHLAWGLSSPHDLPLSALPDVPRSDVSTGDGAATDKDWHALTGGPAPEGVRLDRRQLELVALADVPPAAAVRRLAAGHLERLATRRRPERGWDDLVLPAALEERVRGLVARHRQRHLVYDVWGFPGHPSRGTVALFAGPSGTGKTLTAEVIAGELGLDLFVLDLSSVMSKYIGETEKNLCALFDAAQTGDVVLFFDEADALFGKRSAVSDAKDRYANVEVAYLLQRLERHDGLVLLATNLPNNMDDAFVRRLHATLEFPAPGEAERYGIWQRAFPPGAR